VEAAPDEESTSDDAAGVAPVAVPEATSADSAVGAAADDGAAAAGGRAPVGEAGTGEPTVELPAVPQPQPEPALPTEPAPVAPHPIQQQTTQAATPAAPPPRRRRRALRTVTALLVLGGLVAGAVVAWPTLRDRYVTPVETNTDDIEALTARVDATESRLGELDGAEVLFGTALDDTTGRLDDLDDLIAEQTGRIDDLDDLIAEQDSRIDDLDTLAATLGEDLATSRTDAATAVQVLRATELLGRARLFMFQANYGLAADDMRAARDILAELPADDVAVADAMERLDRAIATAAAFPVVAADDLDVAWQLLLAGDVEN
jgi:uncharacterized coiled-coil protein SlyX